MQKIQILKRLRAEAEHPLYQIWQSYDLNMNVRDMFPKNLLLVIYMHAVGYNTYCCLKVARGGSIISKNTFTITIVDVPSYTNYLTTICSLNLLFQTLYVVF